MLRCPEKALDLMSASPDLSVGLLCICLLWNRERLQTHKSPSAVCEHEWNRFFVNGALCEFLVLVLSFDSIFIL